MAVEIKSLKERISRPHTHIPIPKVPLDLLEILVIICYCHTVTD